MDGGSDLSQRERGLDRLIAHLTAFDPDAQCARERLEGTIGVALTTLLVAALSPRSAPRPLARLQLVAAAA
jgi:hypothetical protein